ncbi:hypothetical protein [Bizionia arctica]|uniref:Uncharacterized protein n=1 Tax=Bizionia arctica TaxID=1495645 RepID=A0A917LP23_9FLAO|nr:hypothetical protein [Bizionia arctica]GGG47239.1 hypothetical protein GCM10010976_18340 [Bizionia arctica]
MRKEVDSIIQLFPDLEEEIDDLFQIDENFRDMCSDYMLCRSMVLERKNDRNINREEFADMEVLQRSLEEEIRVQLNIKK